MKQPKVTADFILAEDIRQEADGRMSIFGYSTNYQLLIPTPKDAPAGTKYGVEIALALVLQNLPEGDHTGEAFLYDPQEKPLLPAKTIVPIKVERKKSATLIIKLKPLFIEHFGTYNFVIKLDGAQEFRNSFELITIEEFDRR